MKTKCCICGDKNTTQIKIKDEEGMMIHFVDATCGHKECVEEFQFAMEEGSRLFEQELFDSKMFADDLEGRLN